jgi:hypothetical protein
MFQPKSSYFLVILTHHPKKKNLSKDSMEKIIPDVALKEKSIDKKRGHDGF